MRAIEGLALALAISLCACGGSGTAGGGDDGDDTPDHDGGNGGDGGGDDDGGPVGPPIDFTNNLLPSPMPPGNLKPADAPMIIAFGWDDCAFTGDHPADSGANDNGMNFIARTFGNITNPNGDKGSVSFYQNAAYLPNTEQGGPWGSETNLMAAAGMELIAAGFEVGNHTFDHLETNGTWGRIPSQYRHGAGGGWDLSVGTKMDLATWRDLVVDFNDKQLRGAYSLDAPNLSGFRAPRLEINDQGLQAIAAKGYQYDIDMEEGMQESFVTAVTKPSAAQQGFKWITWPHTLDNGSPGAWQSQDFDEKHYLVDFPKGLWEVPVYMIYLPDNGLQQRIAQRMIQEITTEPTDWVGDRVREITAFDFNTFLYARLKKAEWVEAMKHTFLARYNGNRAPMTFGAHPEEFSTRYDTEVLSQANNVDFQDVLTYNKFSDRKAAVKEFVAWVKANYPDVYFMSGKQLVDYMQHPFDKQGNPVAADVVAGPPVENLFQKFATWEVTKDTLGSDATVDIAGPGAMNIMFKIGRKDEAHDMYPFVDVATSFPKGTLGAVSHIDIVYETEAPIRVRLLTDEADRLLPMQALLSGVGGERAARIRIKDFTPDPYQDPTAIASHDFVDAAYMAKVVGISFESASVKDNRMFNVKIKRVIVHGGFGGASLIESKAKPVKRAAPGRRAASGKGSSVHWPRHREMD